MLQIQIRFVYVFNAEYDSLHIIRCDLKSYHEWFSLCTVVLIFRYIELFKSSKSEIRHVTKPKPLMSTRPGPYDRAGGFGGPRFGRGDYERRLVSSVNVFAIGC